MCKIISGVVIVLGLALIIAGAVIGWVVYPDLIQDQVELKNGTDQYERFKELPVPFNFKVYAFDIKNPDAVIQGKAKPIVEEKGPYVYLERREKNILSHDGDHITYREVQRYDFNKNASGENSETDMITILNPALTSIAQLADISLIGIIFNKVYKESFGETQNHPFLRETVGKIMFDGYEFCKKKDNLICLMILLKSKELKNIRVDTENDSMSFTFFHHKKDVDDGKYKINDGTDDVSKLGYIEEWNDSKYLKKMWNGKESRCNEVKGRDSIIYPPFIKEDDVIAIFNTDICRTVNLVFDKETKYKEATATKFALDQKTLDSPDNEDNCYCLNQTHGFGNPVGCVQNGLMELKNCYGAPILLSFPHFLWADKNVIDEVTGIHPNESEHLTYVELEPTTGTPFRGYKRIQFSMFLKPSTNFEIFKNAKDTIIPLIWVEEGIEINDELFKTLDDKFLSIKDIVEIGRWAFIGVGIGLVLIGALVCLCWKKDSKNFV